MAQSGYTPLLVYGSSTAAAEPTAPNLTSSANGAELALNYADGKLFYKNSGGNVRLLAIGYGASTVTPTAGGIQYGTGTAVAFTAAGTAGYILQSNGASAPSWVAAPSTSPGGSTTQVQYNNAGAFGGSANFVWDNTNVRLGIGTSSPNNTLAIYQATTPILQLGNSTTTVNAGSGLQMYITGLDSTIINQNAGYLRFGTSGSERMRIDSSGNVGIGTTSPGYRLDVQDAIRIKVDGSNNANLYFNATSTRLYYSDGSGNLSFYTNSTERMIVGYGGGITINYSLGVGTTASSTTGEIRATNNITAYYSDDRLKTRLGSIENALDKVCQLDGFFYEANQTAQDLGYKPVREVGVSAQQVQAVLPEIVVPAPIDEKYLTVRYEKMIPLLVEAIKELRAEIQTLRG